MYERSETSTHKDITDVELKVNAHVRRVNQEMDIAQHYPAAGRTAGLLRARNPAIPLCKPERKEIPAPDESRTISVWPG